MAVDSFVTRVNAFFTRVNSFFTPMNSFFTRVNSFFTPVNSFYTAVQSSYMALHASSTRMTGIAYPRVAPPTPLPATTSVRSLCRHVISRPTKPASSTPSSSRV